MPAVEGQQRVRSCLTGALADDRIVGVSSADRPFRCITKKPDVRGTRQGDDSGGTNEVRLDQRPRIAGRETMRWRQPCQHGIRLNQGRSGRDQPFAILEPALDCRYRRSVMFVPRAHGRHHAARVEREGRHGQRRRFAKSFRVRSTVVDRRGDTFPAGLATSSRPFRSSLTESGRGEISMTPSRQRTSKGVPGWSAASRRISLGMTRRPA